MGVFSNFFMKPQPPEVIINENVWQDVNPKFLSKLEQGGMTEQEIENLRRSNKMYKLLKYSSASFDNMQDPTTFRAMQKKKRRHAAIKEKKSSEKALPVYKKKAIERPDIRDDDLVNLKKYLDESFKVTETEKEAKRKTKARIGSKREAKGEKIKESEETIKKEGKSKDKLIEKVERNLKIKAIGKKSPKASTTKVGKKKSCTEEVNLKVNLKKSSFISHFGVTEPKSKETNIRTEEKKTKLKKKVHGKEKKGKKRAHNREKKIRPSSV